MDKKINGAARVFPTADLRCFEPQENHGSFRLLKGFGWPLHSFRHRILKKMAARQIPRRILSLLLSRQPPPRTSFSSSLRANSLFHEEGLFKRGLQTIAEESKQAVQDGLEKESSNLNSDISCTTAVSSPVANEDTLKHKVTSNLKISRTHDLAMIFTCKVCETRSVKTVSRLSYEKGVVLARCGGCNNTHLIADRLGWFGEPGSIEEFLAARGEEVKKGSADTINLTLDDLAGKEKLDI